MSQRLRIGLASALLLLQALWGTTVGKAQQTAPGEIAATVKVEVRQVLVPVVVTDRRGHHVTGLKPEDFAVLEDDVPQRIVAFSTEAEGLPGLLTEPTTKNPTPTQEASAGSTSATRRAYLLCVDTLNSAFANFSNVRGALQKLFKQERSSDTQYGLVALGRQPLLIQDWTRDPTAALAAIDSKELSKAIQHSGSTNLAVQENQLSMMLAEYCQRCPCAGGPPVQTGRTATGSSQICRGRWERLEMWAGAAAQERTALTRRLLLELRDLVRQLTLLGGKRTLIFISDGFNLRPGRDLFAMLAAYAGDQGVLLRNPGGYVEPELQEVIRLAATHDVTIYTLDSRGLYVTPAGGYDASGEYQMTRLMVILPEIQQQKETVAIENQAAMGELAAATGGVFYHNSNNLLKGMRQAFADGREYYLLAYVSSNRAADSKFREIRVQLKRKDVTARAKRGYWAPTY